MKIWKRYSVGQSPKVAELAVEWRRVLGLARSIDRRVAACVKMCKNLEIISGKKKRVEAAHAHLHDVRTYIRNALLASGSDPTEQKCDDGLVLSTIVICILHAIATFLQP